MFNKTMAVASFAVNDIARARQFYGDVLGLQVQQVGDMFLHIDLYGGGRLFVYHKPDHTPANFTILYFLVADIRQTMAKLQQQTVTIEHYPELGTGPDGIATNPDGSLIAWFKDPFGNVIAILQQIAHD